MGHMNVMWFAGKFDEASWQLLARLGLTPSYMIERGSVLAAVQQNTSYKHELGAGDIITIRSGVVQIREKVIRFLHEMRNDETGAVAAVTEITSVSMDREMRRAYPFPLDFTNRVRQHIADHGRIDPGEIHDTLPQATFSSSSSIPRPS